MGKKVVQFIGSFHQGGSERQALQLAKLLRQAGEFDVYLATLDRRGELLDEAVAAGFDDIQEYKLKSFVSLGFFGKLIKCAAWLRKNKIEIVHTHDFYTNIFGILAARLAGVRVKIASKRETKGIRTESQEKLERFIYRLSRAITVNADAVRAFLVGKGVDVQKIVVIHNGLDLVRLQPKINDRNKIVDVLGLPRDKKFVTLVANMRHGVKNQPMLLRCAKRLKAEFPNVHFVFAGEGERKDFLTGTAEKLGVKDTAHFIDKCRIVPELLSISSVCVLTSYAEGFSNSILEYMAAGKPVVATDVGGAKECIEEGESGFLVDSDDDEAMSEKLKLVLSDPVTAERLGARGRQIVEIRFSTDSQLERVSDLYRSLTGDPAR